VVPGDFIVADGDGAVVVPRAIAAEVASIAVSKAEREPYILSQLKEGRALPGLYPPGEQLEAEYQAWKQGRG
jgi:regulator of RNase E activity RraA